MFASLSPTINQFTYASDFLKKSLGHFESLCFAGVNALLPDRVVVILDGILGSDSGAQLPIWTPDSDPEIK